MKKHTIIYYGNLLLPDRDAASQRTLGNAKALRELGYEVVFIGCKKEVNPDILLTREIFDGFEMYYFEEPGSLKEWFTYLVGYMPIVSIIEKYAAKSIILYNHPSISTFSIINYAHKRNINVYADCTEWFDPKGFSFHSLIKKADTYCRMRVANKKLDGIITISSFLRDFYDKNNVRTICVPPLIDKADAKWYSVPDKWHASDEVVKLVYIGNPGAGTKDKLGLIIKCIEQVLHDTEGLNVQLNIIGVTEEQYREIFLSNYDSIPSFVQFLGKLPHLEALNIVSDSDYSIFIRDNNLMCKAGFPTKFSESIACGTPVLTNDTSDLHKYLINGSNGFMLDDSSNRFLVDSLIKALCINKNKIHEMKKYCMKDATFDYHSFVGEFDRIF